MIDWVSFLAGVATGAVLIKALVDVGWFRSGRAEGDHVRAISQQDLPEDAARLLRENLWKLYD